MSDILAYIGTYTRTEPHVAGKSQGIHILRFDPATGAFSPQSVAPNNDNPSFLTLDAAGTHLYSVNEVGDFEGQAGGGVSAYAIDPDSGELTLLNQQFSGGPAPCYVTIDSGSRHVLVANYSGGSVMMLPVQEDGSLGPASDFKQHAGHSVNPQRQEAPHAHSVTIDPCGAFALAADLGLDQIVVYRLDHEQGKLLANDPVAGEANPGAGPRHIDFHPNGQYAYVINELDSTITVYNWNADDGRLTPVQTVSTLPDNFTGNSTCADIHLSRDGRFLYGSNRGHDSIAVFSVNAETGQLSSLGHTATGGKTPRNFALDPTGQYLLVANQDSDNIVTFRIDADSGRLQSTGHEISVPTPVCIKFLTR